MTEAPPPSALSVDEGLALVLDAVRGGRLASLGVERVPVTQAFGRILAEAPRARWALPSAPLSIMDGYAVRSGDLILARDEHDAEALALELVDESAAGHPSARTLEPGSCARVATGAVVPEGADAVVPQEDTRRIELPPKEAGAAPRVLVEFSSEALAQVGAGRWIRAVGSDVQADALLLPAGTQIGAGEASLLAGTGHPELAVVRRPKVAILSSGDELVSIGQTPARGQIVATNVMVLAAQIREAGGEPIELDRVADRVESMRAAIEMARDTHGADLLVASGGISVGDHDLVLPALEAMGFELGFRRLRLRPGRPTTFGLLPRPGDGSAGESAGGGPPLPVLALPGNPASTFVTFELLARPLIRALSGLPEARWGRAPRRVELAEPTRGSPRRVHYVRARWTDDGRAAPLSKQLSGALRSLAHADLLLRVPEDRGEVPAGEFLDAVVLRE